jgi:uncharacterized protein YbjQ (UPF0145 family)
VAAGVVWKDRVCVSPFFSNRRVQPTEAEQAAAEVDLERIRQGGIPAGAEERLKRIATASTPFFTSDLSAKEYALAQLSGLQPLAQVMGSSVVQSGWAVYRSMNQWVYGGEVRALSDSWNLARSRAFDRLRQEAEFSGADGVIGVEVNWGQLADMSNSLELVVFGTAVRDTAFPTHREDHGIGMCTLSGQEVDKLRRIGAEPVGVVGYTTVQAVQLSWYANYAMNSSGLFGGVGSRNMEVPDVAQAVYNARSRAMSEVERQAKHVGGNEIVISDLRHHIQHHEYEDYSDRKVHVFYVTMHVLGTAVKLGVHPPHPSPLTGPTMTINLGK